MGNNNKEFKKMKKELGITNSDVAEIIGLESSSVKNATSPNVKSPSWVRGMVYVWKRFKNVD